MIRPRRPRAAQSRSFTSSNRSRERRGPPVTCHAASKPRDRRFRTLAIGLALFCIPLLAPLAVFAQGSPCVAPSAPSFAFTPPKVGVGQTYAVTWTVPGNLDAAGGYVIERSKDSAFATILDSQRVSSSYASFLASTEGTFVHRVRAFAGCDPSKVSANSATASVSAQFGSPSVVFTVQPRPVITTLNDALANYKTSFKLENLSRSDVTVNIIAAGSFFRVTRPDGTDVPSDVTLAPRVPTSFDVRFLGVPVGTEAAYQGVVFLRGSGQNLSITPYAFVNLKVGGSDTATPVFQRAGKPVEYLFFPGFSSGTDDSSRPAQSIDIFNPGSSPMQLGAEIGPEVWLQPPPGWNSAPIPPGGSLRVDLKTIRAQAPTGSALPRYTYFTVRTKSGQSARLLAQDNDAVSLSSARSGALAPEIRTFIVPYVTSDAFQGRDVYSRVRLSNISGQKLNAEIFYTPAGKSGFDSSAVLHATVIVPANDVVSLSDPLQQVFGLRAPASGQFEIRTEASSADRIGALSVSSSVVTVAPDGGLYSYQMPVATRGEGARSGFPQSIVGLTSNGFIRSDLILAETAGLEGATVRITVFDKDGQRRGERNVALSPYSQIEVADLLVAVTGVGLDAARVQIDVDGGGGQVIGIAKVLDTTTNAGATLVSEPISTELLRQRAEASTQRVSWGAPAATTAKFVIPGVVRGVLGSGQNVSYQTNLGLAAPFASGATFTVTFIESTGTRTTKVVSVSAGKTSQLDDVLKSLFLFSSGIQGTITVEGPFGSRIYAQLVPVPPAGKGALAAALGVLPTTSDAVTGATASAQRPIYVDGMEQSVDSTRGTRWFGFISEFAGQPATFRIRLYEAGNRTLPIAEKQFTLAAYQQLKLDSVFTAMDLDTDDRRKDRTNVMMVISPESGNGYVVAQVIALDNRSNDAQALVLTPTGGLSPTGLAGRVSVPPPPVIRVLPKRPARPVVILPR